MKKTLKMMAALLISSSLMVTGAASASAFSDVKDSKQREIVKELQTKGIISGISADKFAPGKTITAAQAVKMVVKAVGLKALPNLTGKSFPSVPKGAWFAAAVNIAAMHGLPVNNEMKWNQPITKEEFANLLYAAIQATGDYPVIMMYIHVADEKEMKKESTAAVQFLLLTKIAELDKDSKFHPKKQLNRMEAAKMTHAAMKFIAEHAKKPPVDDKEQPGDGVTTDIIKVNDEVNKVVITKDNLPHPGYGIAVTNIEFKANNEAVVYYKVTQPDPDKMYPQVISKASTEVYVSAKYKVTVKATPQKGL